MLYSSRSSLAIADTVQKYLRSLAVAGQVHLVLVVVPTGPLVLPALVRDHEVLAVDGTTLYL